MELKKSLSVKIDGTIEGFLNFIVRYFFTIFSIIRHPLSPQIILNDTVTPPTYSQPLTFLALGAFSFSLLIGVYPQGFMGMLDLIWFVDELKKSVHDNWKQAISVTSLLTVGMPVIFAITGFAALAGRYLFINNLVRRKWFEANCYAFGFQSIIFFLVFSLDSFLSALETILPFLAKLPLSESFVSIASMSTLFCVVIISLVWPIIFIVSSLLKLKELDGANRKSAFLVVGVVYCFSIQYLYAGAASVLPNLKKEYFASAKSSVSISMFEVKSYLAETDEMNIELEFVVDNISEKDYAISIPSNNFELEWGVIDEESKESWYFDESKAKIVTENEKSNTVLIKKKSVEKYKVQLPLSRAKEMYCYVIEQEKNQINNTREGESLSQLYFSYEANSNISNLSMKEVYPLEVNIFASLIVQSGVKLLDNCTLDNEFDF